MIMTLVVLPPVLLFGLDWIWVYSLPHLPGFGFVFFEFVFFRNYNS